MIWSLVAAGCGAGDARYGEITLAHEAPSATLTGRTRALRSASELSPRCAGFVDPGSVDHVLHVSPGAGKIRATARSNDGPVVLVIAEDDEIFCDADEGTGHAPALVLLAASTYEIRVGSLTANRNARYELRLEPDDKASNGPAPAGGEAVSSVGAGSVSVTVTSDPPGAQVRTSSGHVLGTTPAMFVVPAPAASQPLAFEVVGTNGARTTVSGQPAGGEMVLHAALGGGGAAAGASGMASTTPGRPVTVRAATPQHIRDFSTVRQSADQNDACTIADLEVDVEIRHTYQSDLLVSLAGPDGTSATLHRHRGGSHDNLVHTYRARDVSALARLIGRTGQGRWTMTVRDTVEQDVGTFESFTLRLVCGDGPPVATAQPRTARRPHRRPRLSLFGPGARQPLRGDLRDPFADRQ